MDAAGLGDSLRAMLVLVREHEDELNRLNVFPVRDHDTGTNMVLTLEGVVRAVEGSDDRPVRELAAAVVDAALLEARGNSGTILAEVLRGLFETWAPLGEVGPDDLARGFRAAAERAEQAVLEPVEGTILTVVRATADALEQRHAADVAALLAAAAEVAGRAVEATTEQLEVLRRAEHAGPRPARGGPAFEVQYLLACGEQDAEELKAYLAGIGESIAVARTDGLYRIHVHTDHAGAAIEEAVRRGATSQIQVACLGSPAPG